MVVTIILWILGIYISGYVLAYGVIRSTQEKERAESWLSGNKEERDWEDVEDTLKYALMSWVILAMLVWIKIKEAFENPPKWL